MNNVNYVDLVNEAVQLALLGISQYQKARAIAAENGVSDAELAAADARFANIVPDPLLQFGDWTAGKHTPSD